MDHLLENFYTELSSTFLKSNSGEFSAVIRLNPQHPVYKGHFEQVPVAPGVCLVQIIKEILMNKFEKQLFLSAGDNIKFLSLINPNDSSDFTISFSVKENEAEFQVTANYTLNGVSYVKFKGKFQTITV